MTFLKNQENVRIRINKIDEENWWKTTNNLLWYDENAENTTIQEENLRGLDDSKLTELTEALKATKTEKTAGMDGINAEIQGTNVTPETLTCIQQMLKN